MDREVPRSGFGPVGRALLATGKMNILVAGKTPTRTTRPRRCLATRRRRTGSTSRTSAGVMDVTATGLSGGRVAGPPGLPPASNLTPAGIGSWTEADLTRALREGKRPDGSRARRVHAVEGLPRDDRRRDSCGMAVPEERSAEAVRQQVVGNASAAPLAFTPAGDVAPEDGPRSGWRLERRRRAL